MDIDNSEFHVEILHVVGDTVDLGEGGSVSFVLLLKFPLPGAVVEVLAFVWGSGTSNIVPQPKREREMKQMVPARNLSKLPMICLV